MRNIVHVIFDCLRADHCGFMGYTRDATPNLDKMANKGIFFENAIAHSIATLPSVVGMFTGRYPLCNSKGSNREEWSKEIKGRTLLAEELKKSGYHTAAFQPNPRLSRYYGVNKGFDFYHDFINKEDNLVDENKLFAKVNKYFKKEAGYINWESFYEQILRWREQASSPYYLLILLMDTHGPYSTTPRSEKSGAL